MILTNEEGRKVISRKTNMFIVKETRERTPFRALPREFKDRILGNASTGVTATKLIVRYQEFQNQAITAVRCWKCGRPVMGYQPLYRGATGKDSAGRASVTIVNLNGKEMVLGSLLPYAHYREGVFNARTANGRFHPFSYIHCADCHFKDEDGSDLLACHLGGHDIGREKARQLSYDDDAWAQSMYTWSGAEPIGIVGPSLSPEDLMKKEVEQQQKGTP